MCAMMEQVSPMFWLLAIVKLTADTPPSFNTSQYCYLASFMLVHVFTMATLPSN
jgi:hypothetical protein